MLFQHCFLIRKDQKSTLIPRKSYLALSIAFQCHFSTLIQPQTLTQYQRFNVPLLSGISYKALTAEKPGLIEVCQMITELCPHIV